jgi:hypothetical protein
MLSPATNKQSQREQNYLTDTLELIQTKSRSEKKRWSILLSLGNVSFQEAGLNNQSSKLYLSKPCGKILNKTFSGKIQAGPLATRYTYYVKLS